MRKSPLFLLVLLVPLFWALFCVSALAEIYVLDDLKATVEVPDSYIVLKSDNLSPNYVDWLISRGTTAEEASADFANRGVLLQCWTADYDACFELTATQTEFSKNLFDINEQTNTTRGSYRLSHYPDNEFLNQGFDFSSADWKNTSAGRFLVMRYIKRDNGEILHRGLMRRTIRNGYEITLDYRVYGRALTNKDNSALNKIWDSFDFVEVLPLPPAASAKVNITQAPPTETNSASFTLEGTAAKGVKLTAVVMGLSYPTPMLHEVEVSSSGKFKLPIKLPKEGVFLVTITCEYQGEDVLELAYPVTYQRTLLTVNVLNAPGEVITSDETVISGTGEPGASIQVFINSEPVANKKVTSAGKFKIELDTSSEGSYDVALVFSKKNLTDRRIHYTFSRQWSENDMIRQLKAQAIKPGYKTLVSKIAGYEGRIMGYNCYLVDVTESGDEWIAQMALTKKGSEYTSIILVVCNEKPSFSPGERVMMYGTCVGMSLPAEEDETQASYPCFELLLFASIE